MHIVTENCTKHSGKSNFANNSSFESNYYHIKFLLLIFKSRVSWAEPAERTASGVRDELEANDGATIKMAYMAALLLIRRNILPQRLLCGSQGPQMHNDDYM